MEKIQVKLIRKTAVIKVLEGLGMVNQVLPPHTANEEVQLIMVAGEILFTLADQLYTLKTGDFQIIPANQVHSLKVQAACQFYLIMPVAAKMSFSKSTI